MSEGNVTTNIHALTAFTRTKELGTKFDFPPSNLGKLDEFTHYFATNALLPPLAFTSVGVVRSQLRKTAVANELAEMFGDTSEISKFNELRGGEELQELADDHTEEIGYTAPERPTIEVARLYMTLLKTQYRKCVVNFAGDYAPYTPQQAIDWLAQLEAVDKTGPLLKANAEMVDKELAELGVDIEELHAREKDVNTQQLEADKLALKEQRPKIIETLKGLAVVENVIVAWKEVPLVTQYKCCLRVHKSLIKALARKSARVKANPKHEQSAQMANEMEPIALAIKTLVEDMHATVAANKQVFSDAFDIGQLDAMKQDLPKLMAGR